MRYWRWQPGRQGSGYAKCILAGGRTFWDAYLLSYPPGSHIPTHTDPVPGKRHFRMNVTLFGERAFVGRALLRLGPVVIFRPDVAPHSVERVSRRRLVLSIGVAL